MSDLIERSAVIAALDGPAVTWSLRIALETKVRALPPAEPDPEDDHTTCPEVVRILTALTAEDTEVIERVTRRVTRARDRAKGGDS